MKIAEILKELREDRGISQLKMSQLTGISHSTIARWELGQCDPPASGLIVLAEFFNISVDELLGRTSAEQLAKLQKSNINVGEKLKILRKNSGLTQKQIAEFLGVSISTVSAWENNVYEIDFQNLRKLADFFEVSVDELLGRTPAPTLFDNARVPKTKVQEMFDQLNDVGKARALGYIENLLESNQYLLIRKAN